MKNCANCRASNFLLLTTYKRNWHFCRECGTAFADQRKNYPLRFLPVAEYRRRREVDEEKMYDYFVEPSHIEWSIGEGKDFLGNYLQPHGIDVAGKSVLDISGGNGYALTELEKAGASVTLTEINRKTIEYARTTHGFPVFEYNLNEHNLHDVTNQTYDIILARACIMFARDVRGFAAQVRESLKPGGVLVIHQSVKPTLGVLLRIQIDEFSYNVLRQPEALIEACSENGLVVERRIDETDQTLYVYDHDLRKDWALLHYMYELRNVKKLRKERPFELPARDRRRNTLFFRRSS